MDFDLAYFVVGIAILYLVVLLSNPHLPVSLVRRNYNSYTVVDGQIRRVSHRRPVKALSIFYPIVLAREGITIATRFHTLEKILKYRKKRVYRKIYKLIVHKRFNPKSPYLISGNHFSSFYPRNVGLFFSKALAPQSCLNTQDYCNRVISYMQSISFALEYYKYSGLTTTIVPLFHNYFISWNAFSKPADTLCSLLISFDYLFKPERYDLVSDSPEVLRIQESARESAKDLLDEFKDDLRRHTLAHLEHFDDQLKLINREASLSGIRDGCFRESSFYENVCAWKSIQLALEYQIITQADLKDCQLPENLKQVIMARFCKDGIIYNELKEYPDLLDNISADFSIAHSLDFFDLEKPEERKILKDQVDAILNSDLMTEIGMFYSRKNPERLAFWVKAFAGDYMGRTVWSHWAVELGLVLLGLEKYYPGGGYRQVAESLVKATIKKIEQYRGYPELYDENLKIYKNFIYVSLIDTGWIVNFEYLRQKLL